MTGFKSLLLQNVAKVRHFVNKYEKIAYVGALGVTLMYSLFLPNQTSAQRSPSLMSLVMPKNMILSENAYSPNDFPNTFTLAKTIPARREVYVSATAYSSTPDQTDSTPCNTANGFDVCAHGRENIIATNALPFGTRVRFPELYGDEIFYVMDRMNARYTTRVDFWKTSRETAKQFGLKYVKMEIL